MLKKQNSINKPKKIQELQDLSQLPQKNEDHQENTLKISKNDDERKRNFKSSKNFQENFDLFMNGFISIEEKKYEPLSEEEWKHILYDPNAPVERNRLFASIQEGIPKKLRRRIWLYLAKVDKTKKEFKKKNITYKMLLGKECKDLKNIKKDVTRTFPEFEMFKNQKTDRDLETHLMNILIAYANLDPEIGYTQGMNFLVANLLYHMDLEKVERDYIVLESSYEEDVFWILVHIMIEKSWRKVYMDGTPKLLESLRELDSRMKNELPNLYNILVGDCCLDACFSQCYLTLLCYNSPLSFAKRVLDMFLLEGENILTEILIKLLSKAEPEILKKKQLEELYPFLRNDLVRYCYEQNEKKFSKFVSLPEEDKYTIIERIQID